MLHPWLSRTLPPRGSLFRRSRTPAAFRADRLVALFCNPMLTAGVRKRSHTRNFATFANFPLVAARRGVLFSGANRVF
jgi:hypothetical protein